MKRAVLGIGLVVTFIATPALSQAPEDTTWFGPFGLDLSGGVQSLEADATSVSGRAYVAYTGPNFGGAVLGDGGSYDFGSASSLAQNDRLEGYGEFWYLFGEPKQVARLELGLAGGGAYYDTTYAGDALAGSGRSFSDETSSMGRGSLLVGGRFHSKPFSARLALGGGLQLEDYSILAVGTGVTIDDSIRTTVRLQGRVAARWEFIANLMSLRLTSSADYFRLRRTDESIQLVNAQVLPTTTTVSEQRQFESTSRLFLDLDIASFYGLMPAVFGGVDIFRLSGDAGDLSTTVPVAGIGIFKPDF